MSQENKGSALGGVVVLAAIGFFVYFVGSNIYREVKPSVTGPAYQAGDCVAERNESKAEKWQFQTTYSSSYRIEEVGEKSYRVQYWFGALSNDYLASRAAQTTMPIRWIDSDEDIVKVDCTELVQIHAREKQAYEEWQYANEGR